MPFHDNDHLINIVQYVSNFISFVGMHDATMLRSADSDKPGLYLNPASPLLSPSSKCCNRFSYIVRLMQNLFIELASISAVTVNSVRK